MLDFVTVHDAKSLSDALLLKGFLESSGIPALVPGSFEMGYGLLVPVDARVQVVAENEARARDVVQAWLHPESSGSAGGAA